MAGLRVPLLVPARVSFPCGGLPWDTIFSARCPRGSLLRGTPDVFFFRCDRFHHIRAPPSPSEVILRLYCVFRHQNFLVLRSPELSPIPLSHYRCSGSAPSFWLLPSTALLAQVSLPFLIPSSLIFYPPGPDATMAALKQI